MIVEAATDSHLELDKDQEEDEWDEQGYVMEREELDDIYGDDELEELEASLKLAMENQLKRIEQSNESYQPTHYESIMQGARSSISHTIKSQRVWPKHLTDHLRLIR